MSKQNLPKNWVVLSSKTHPDRVYYFNVKTNQSSWTMPTTNQAGEGVGNASRKRKKLVQEDEIIEVEPTHNKIKVEISGRKKLVAKKVFKKTQDETIKEKETPQMKAIRDKMLKKQENNKLKIPRPPKTVTKTLPLKSETITTSEQKINTNPNSKPVITSITTCTPQMQVLIDKIVQKSRQTSKISKVKEDEIIIVDNQTEAFKTKLRNQNVCNQKDISSSRSSSRRALSQERRDSEISIKCDLTKVTKQGRKSARKNLGKDRMETLRKSLEECKNRPNPSPRKLTILSPEINIKKSPVSCKTPEVIPTRVQETVIKENISVNKRLRVDECRETVNLPKETSITIDLEKSTEDSLYEEMDWEPLEDEKITFEVQAVRTKLCTENDTNKLHNVPSSTLRCSLLEQEAKRSLYIVVDTNVFLTNINAIELARETSLKTYDHTLIMIPWTVIRELDYIKDNKGKTKSTALVVKARKAINYINKLISSKQPRIITQKPEDVAKNKERFSTDCPDDEILQTCLQIQKLGKPVVLLSYDVNLCNKAMIYDIVTLGRSDPFEKIDYLYATNNTNRSLLNSNIQSKNITSTESALNSNIQNRNRMSIESVLDSELILADEIYENTKSILRDCLSVIVMKEMHSLYGDSWEKYVLIAPPWTTLTVLQCAIKHWIAAVSESFKRKADVILKDLLQIFRNAAGKKTLKETSYILEKCSSLAQMIDVNKHPDLMLRVSKKIEELMKQCHEYECQISEEHLHNAIGVENDVEEQERRADKAFRYFEAVYVYARDMCGLASKAVGAPCNFHYNIPNPVPSMENVKQVKSHLGMSVNKLSNNLNAIMEQIKNSSVNYRTLIDLHQTLVEFFPPGATIKLPTIDLLPLDLYCCIKRKSDVLNRGLHQLQELNSQLCSLANYRFE